MFLHIKILIFNFQTYATNFVEGLQVFKTASNCEIFKFCGGKSAFLTWVHMNNTWKCFYTILKL